MIVCKLAHLHTEKSPKGDYCRARTKHAAANRAAVRRMAASLTIPWARKHKCTVKEAMMFANQSKEARLEMLS